MPAMINGNINGLIMKTKTDKTMIGAAIVALLLCAVSIIWIIANSYCIATGSGEGCIYWHEDLYPVQAAVFIGRLVFKPMFYALIVAFIIKQFKAIKNGVLFPSINVKILYWLAFCYLIGNSCSDNVSTSLLFDGNTGSFIINGDTLLYAAVLVIFALIYKIAVNVSEENNLTI